MQKDIKQLMIEFLHHVLEAHVTASLLDFLCINDESDPLTCSSQEITESWLEKTADKFTAETVACPTDELTSEADHLHNFHRSFIHAALLYHDLRDAIKYEDGPGIIR